MESARAGQPLRRVKTYSAQSGYVYQYCLGKEKTARYTFALAANREKARELSISVADEALRRWTNETGQELLPREVYAVAKLALFQVLDTAERPELLPREHQVSWEELREHAAVLGFTD